MHETSAATPAAAVRDTRAIGEDLCAEDAEHLNPRLVTALANELLEAQEPEEASGRNQREELATGLTKSVQAEGHYSNRDIRGEGKRALVMEVVKSFVAGSESAAKREMGSQYNYGEAAVALWQSGRKEAALKMMEKLNEHSHGAPVSSLIEKIAETGDEGLVPMLQKIANIQRGWVGNGAQSAARQLG